MNEKAVHHGDTENTEKRNELRCAFLGVLGVSVVKTGKPGEWVVTKLEPRK